MLLKITSFVIFVIVGVFTYFRSKNAEYAKKDKMASLYALLVFACTFFIGMLAGPILIKIVSIF
jgi:hypothetical protein